MKRTLSAVAALAILLVAALLAAHLVLGPLSAPEGGTEEAIRRYEAIAARREPLRQALAAMPPAPAESVGRLPQTSDALAQADLQSQLAAWAAQAGVAVSSAEPLAEEEGGDPTRIQLGLDLSGSLAGLQALLYRIESGRPVLAVTRLDLTARPDHSLAAHLTVAAWRSAP